jgi:hypothetical protein
MFRIVFFALVITLSAGGPTIAADTNNPLGGLFNKLQKDLKKAGDKLNKLNKGGQKTQNNNSSSSRSNFSNSVKSSAPSTVVTGNSTGSSNLANNVSGNPIIVKACVPGLNEFNSIKRPASNVSKVLSDFGMGRDELEKALERSSSSGAKYILDLSYYDGAFDDRAVDAIYRQFINSVNGATKVELLGELATAMTASGFSKGAKLQARDAMAAYGIIHVYMSGNGGNKKMGDKLIMDAAKQKQIIAPYIIGMRFFKGYGKPVDLTAGASWIQKSRKALYEKKKNNRKLSANQITIEADNRLYKMVVAHWFELGLDPRYPRRDQVLEGLAMYEEMLAEHEKEFGSQAANSNIGSVSNEVVKKIALINIDIQEKALRLLGDTKSADLTKQMVEKFRADAASDATIDAMVVFIGETNQVLNKLVQTADVPQKQALVDLIVRLEDHIAREEKLMGRLVAHTIVAGLSPGDVERAARILPAVGYMKKSACKAWTNLITVSKRVNAPVPVNRDIEIKSDEEWLEDS